MVEISEQSRKLKIDTNPVIIVLVFERIARPALSPSRFAGGRNYLFKFGTEKIHN